jgi:hypothetical protein
MLDLGVELDHEGPYVGPAPEPSAIAEGTINFRKNFM